MQSNYGQLLTPDIKLHRKYFEEMVRMLGIYVMYRAPCPGKQYTTYAEIDSCYTSPIQVGCIFDEHPTQQTMRKMGWVAELQPNSSFIHVPYDLPDLQQGSLFIIPSGIDNAKGRIFRVVRMSTTMVYPASVSCEIVPEYEDTYVPETNDNYNHSSVNLINEEPESMFIR